MHGTTTTGYPQAAATTMSFCQSCITAMFASPPAPISVAQPPPMMTSHYYYHMISPGGTAAAFLPSLFGSSSVREYVPKNIGPSSYYVGIRQHHASLPSAFSSRTPSFFGVASSTSGTGDFDETSKDNGDEVSSQKRQPRIAIVGGGIAGVTAANALSKKFFTSEEDSPNAEIVVFEGDVEGGHRCVDFGNCEQPAWIAATARNANSLVPGAAMHVMSQRKTLLKIAKDTVREWYSERVESLQHWLQKEHVNYELTKNIDNFDVIPPYFALHLFRCIGPSATWEERATFTTFLKNFLIASVSSGEAQANERGEYIQRLAKSNRFSFLEAINGGVDGKALATKIGLGRGFVSLHRTSRSAIDAFNEGKLFGETSFIMPLEEAVKLEPRISNLPMQSQLFAVHRIDDYTANSAVFVQDLIEKIKGRGVQYRCGEVGMIQDVSRVECKQHQTRSMNGASKPLATAPTRQRKPGFKITTEDGSIHHFDYVVLAAGVNTPLLARKLSVGESCPTYPLRGYSLTIYTNHTDGLDTKNRQEQGRSANLLNMPLSIDDIYCSSVGVNMARMAGFGELVGYRDRAADVPSLAPRVIARYGKALFPESNAADDAALQCFRPMSPDDIPIVGGVSSAPGLYFHTGHGTLGWTLCLATSECLAQALHDDVSGNETGSTYQLPGNIEVDRARLSPDRFL